MYDLENKKVTILNVIVFLLLFPLMYLIVQTAKFLAYIFEGSEYK